MTEEHDWRDAIEQERDALKEELRRLRAKVDKAEFLVRSTRNAADMLLKCASEIDDLKALLREAREWHTKAYGDHDTHNNTFLERLDAALGGVNKATCPPHSWTQSDGEKCSKCGMKDWMTG